MAHRDEERRWRDQARHRRDFEDERQFDGPYGRNYNRDWEGDERNFDEQEGFANPYGERERYSGRYGYGGQDYTRDWERSSGRRHGDAYGAARGRYGRGQTTGGYTDTFGRSDYGYQSRGYPGGYGRSSSDYLDQPDDRDFWRGRDDDYQRSNWRSGQRRMDRSSSQMDVPADWQYEEEDDYSPSTWTYYEYWFIPGPYVGEGPQGYQRSDERIREDVSDRLTWHGQINARDVQIEVEDCEVTLKGSVDTRYDKRLAEDIAESVMGVRDVHNELRVRKPGRQMRAAAGGQERFERQEGLASKRINGGEIRRNMEVVGKDGEAIGRVKEIRQNDFLVDREMARDVFVPFSACKTVDDRVTLTVPAGEVDRQGWQTPDLVDMDS